MKVTKQDFSSRHAEHIPLVLVYEGGNRWPAHDIMPTIAAKSFQFYNGLSRIFILGNRKIDCKSCFSVDLQKLKMKDPREHKFAQHYIHVSSNNVEYEMFCFRRHFWLLQFMREHSISKVLFTDVDIMYTSNVIELIGVGSYQNIAMKPYGSFFVVWTIEALNLFCDFMIDFYRQPTQKIFQDIINISDRYIGHKPPPSWPKGEKVKQWSDMYIFQAFLQSDPGIGDSFYLLSTNQTFPNWSLFDNARKFLEARNKQKLVDVLSWEQKTIRMRHFGNMTCSYANPSYQNAEIPGIHFQGYTKQQQLPMFNHMFKNLDAKCKEYLDLLL